MGVTSASFVVGRDVEDRNDNHELSSKLRGVNIPCIEACRAGDAVLEALVLPEGLVSVVRLSCTMGVRGLAEENSTVVETVLKCDSVFSTGTIFVAAVGVEASR